MKSLIQLLPSFLALKPPSLLYAYLFCFLLSTPSWAQKYDFDYGFDTDTLVNLSRPKVTHWIELGVSANAYSGDLGSYTDWSSVFHAGLVFNRGRVFNSRLGFSAGFLTGEDRFYTFEDGSGERTTPNTFFRTPIFSLDYELRAHLIKSRTFLLYLSVGAGVLRFNPQDEFGENLVDLQDTRAFEETYGNFALQFPIGVGFSYLFKNGYGLGTQAQLMNNTTDYLDNISEWGVQSGSDNSLRFKFYFLIPLKKEPLLRFPKRIKPEETYTR